MRHRGLERCQSEVRGRQGGSDRAPRAPPGTLVRAGGADGVGSGARGDSLSSRNPRVAPAPPLKLYGVKFPSPEGPATAGRPGGRARGPGAGGPRGRWALRGGRRGRRASPYAAAAACVSGLTFVRARAASAARPPTRVFCNQSVRLIKGGATAS